MSAPSRTIKRTATSAPLNIQLAIQGGGAKICALMATMEAVQELQDAGELKVTRIAGTSAGAIIGCLFAAGVRMKQVKTLLVDGRVGEELVRLFPMPGKFKIARHLRSGKPFWSTRVLEQKLAALFEAEQVFYLKDLREKKGVEVIVIAADLRDAQKVPIPEDTSIVNAIMDSSGLPYCFRTWKNGSGGGSLIVDGGICENLPVDGLEADLGKYGPIVPVTFNPVMRRTPDTITTFSMALLDTAMNNAITRARGSVPPDHVFSIRTSITTFDFDKALNDGLKGEYGDVKRQAQDWFSAFVKLQRRELFHVSEDPWTEQSATLQTIMSSLGEIYKGQHAQSFFKYIRCNFLVQANCLLEEGELHYGDPDEMLYELTFQPDKEPLYCMSIGLSQPKDTTHLGKTSFQLFDASNHELSLQYVPIINPDESRARELLICFTPALKPGNGSYRLRLQDQAIGLMRPLRETGEDELSFFPRRALGPVKNINLILQIPERLKNAVRMAGKAGRRLLDSELVDYRANGFWTLGWKGDDIVNPGLDGFRVDFNIY